MKRLSCAMALVVGGLISVTDRGHAEPNVLHDNGQWIPIEPYFEPIAPVKTVLMPSPELSLPSAAGFGLPVKTPSMTPGNVESQTIPALDGKMVGASPLFIVGADQWSLQWLQQNREHLIGMDAVGMVVAVEKEQELEILRRAASGLHLFAASGEMLAETTGLRHYPALIAPPGIVVQ